jgi:hypothetical protein
VPLKALGGDLAHAQRGRGVVHQHVQLWKPFMNCVRNGPHRRRRREVDLHDRHTGLSGRLDDLVCCCLAALLAAAREDHLRAHPGELACGFFAHAAVGAGDQRNAPGKIRLERTVPHGVLPAGSGYARMSALR